MTNPIKAVPGMRGVRPPGSRYAAVMNSPAIQWTYLGQVWREHYSFPVEHEFMAVVRCRRAGGPWRDCEFRFHVHAMPFSVDGEVPWVFGGFWERGVPGSGIPGAVMQRYWAGSNLSTVVDGMHEHLLAATTENFAAPPDEDEVELDDGKSRK